METNKIALFKGKSIRRTIYQNEWWFSVVDVVQALTDQPDNLMARKYWNKLAERLRKEGSELVTICHQLKLLASDGKMRLTDCANPEGIFRIIQSVPSPKASFGVTPAEYKKLKGLKRENLRDHMDDFELIFTMLGERSTTEIHRTEDSKGFPKLKKDATRGGKIAGIARRELEKEIRRPVVSKDNYLSKTRKTKKLPL